MPLVNPKGMLEAARAGGYCVGAFNLVDFLTMEAIVEAAEEKRAPVILQTSSATVKRFGVRKLVAMARIAAGESPVPVALHLDHGTDPQVISQAIRAGYTSVMIDGSKYPFEENVASTRKVVEEAHAAGVAVEGEIGRVAGVEDDIVVHQDEAIYTTPDEALEFQRRTGVDFLAAAIGTAHGFYKVEPQAGHRHAAPDPPRGSLPRGRPRRHRAALRRGPRAGRRRGRQDERLHPDQADLHRRAVRLHQAHRTEYDILKLLTNAQSELVKMIGEYMEVLGAAGKA